jgi:DHA1 family tetracycline resistance protein-like MFS transporter
MTTAVPGTPRARAAFAFIFITVFLDMLAVGIIVPILPRLIVAFRGGDTASAAAIYGLFGAVWAGMQFVFSPVVGSLSDRFGRRHVILLSNFGLGVDYVLMALAPSIGWLFAGRVISGITSSSFSAAAAYVADVTPPEDRAGKYGMLGAAFALGFIIGPAAGGLLGEIGLRAPFWAAAALSLVNFAYGAFILPESLPPERRAPFRWRRANPIGAFQMLRTHALVPLAVAGFLSMLAHDSLPTTFVLYADFRYHWTTRDIGLVLGVVGLAFLLVQGGLVRRVVAVCGERRGFAIGLAAGAFGLAIAALAPTGAIFLAAVPFTALYGLAHPTLQTLMTRRVGPSEQGQLQGAAASLNGIANMAAPVVFTQIFALAIGRYAHLGAPGAPFLVASLLLVAALAVGWRASIAVAAAPRYVEESV